MKVYSTLTGKVENFETVEPGHVRMYCCGPTVYGLLHIGNFRGAVFYNFVRNWLEEIGYKVTYVYNFTDVDDKIINRAKDENTTAEAIAEKYIVEFKKDYGCLKLRPHSVNPRVSDHMQDIVDMVNELVKKEKAYVVDGEVLYSVKSFADYGKLSKRRTDELESGVRIEVDAKKRDPQDFALWKPAKQGEPSWKSPWSAGRPGWHIECSAMARALLGDQIDIHGGGLDLVFPHHENEIAQSEGCTGKQFARYWMHNNMINMAGAKMSKSLGNLVSGRDFFEQYNPEIYKYMMMSVHYRSVTDFSEQAIEHAISALARIYSALASAEFVIATNTQAGTGALIAESDSAFQKQIDQAWSEIRAAFSEDFSTPQAFAKLFEIVRAYNSLVKRGAKLSAVSVGRSKQFKEFVEKFGSYMSLFQEPPSEFLIRLDDMLLLRMNLKRSDIDAIVAERVQARANKDFAKSDELRAKLNAMKISVSDTAQGSFWEVEK